MTRRWVQYCVFLAFAGSVDGQVQQPLNGHCLNDAFTKEPTSDFGITEDEAAKNNLRLRVGREPMVETEDDVAMMAPAVLNLRPGEQLTTVITTPEGRVITITMTKNRIRSSPRVRKVLAKHFGISARTSLRECSCATNSMSPVITTSEGTRPRPGRQSARSKK